MEFSDKDRQNIGATRRQVLKGMAAAAPFVGVGGFALSTPAAYAATDPDTVVVTIGTEIVTLDPDRYSNWNDYWVIGNMFEGLQKPDLNGDLVPALAEAIDLSADGLVYTITLRNGATFHNGAAVTSDDAIFSLERTFDPETRNQRRTLLSTNIDGVERVDDRTFRLKLKNIDSETISKFSLYWQIKPKAYVEEVGDEGFASAPIGTGPYKFVERRPNQHVMMTRFEEYWGEKPETRNVTLKIVPEEQARLAQVLAGEADIVTPISPVVAERLKGSTQVNVVQVKSLLNVILFYSTLHPETAKKDVRHALSYAIDRESMRKSLVLGYATQQELWCTDAQPGCDNSGVDPFTYDPKKARALLEQANFDFDKPIKFLGQAGGRVAASRETCETIAQYYSQVGVKTELELLEFGAWNAIKGAEVKDPSYAVIFSTAPDPSKDVAYKLAVNTNSKTRSAYVFDTDNDAMLAKMNSFIDPQERYDYLNKILRRIHDEAFLLPLWAMDSLYVTAKNIDLKVPPYLSFTVLDKVTKTTS